jgi:hypothetical protein
MALTVSSILDIRSVSLEARAVLLGLLSFRNRITGQCNPAVSKLAERLGASQRTVERRLQELKQVGVLEVQWHSRSSSYVFHIVGQKDFHTVENSDSCSATFGGSGDSCSATVGGSCSANVGGSGAAYPYMNQTSYEPTNTSAAAAVSKATEKGAAAAALMIPVEKAPEHSEPALAESPKAPEQISLPLEPVEAVSQPDPAEALAQELVETHPQPGLARRAVGEVRKALAAGWTADAIRERHGEWRAYWATLPAGKFIPMLWRWFVDGDYESKPVIRKPPVVETYGDRVMRMIREA